LVNFKASTTCVIESI
jgi:hypothetical protein